MRRRFILKDTSTTDGFIAGSVVLLLLVASNLRLHRYYDFEDASAKHTYGTVRVFVRGTWRDVDSLFKVTDRKGPYVVVVSLRNQEVPGAPAAFRIIRAVSGTAALPQLEAGQTTLTSRVQCCAGSIETLAALSLRNIELPFHVLRIEGTITYNGRTEPFNVTLTPKYSWSVRSEWLDALASV